MNIQNEIHKSFKDHMFDFLKESLELKILIVIHIINMMIGMVNWWIFSTFIDGPKYIWLYLLLKLIDLRLQCFLDKYAIGIGSSACLKFKELGYKPYDRFTYQSKNENNINLYTAKLDAAASNFDNMIGWGVYTLSNLLRNIGSCLIISFKTESTLIPISILTITLIGTKFIVFPTQKIVRKIRKETREESIKKSEYIRTQYPFFVQKERNTSEIVNLVKDLRYCNDKVMFGFNENWSSIKKLEMITFINLILIITYSETNNLVLTFSIFTSISAANHNLLSFLDKDNRMFVEYKNWQEIVTEVSYTEEQPQYDLVLSDLIINYVEVKNEDKFKLSGKLNFTFGNNICIITAPTGSGKTSFLNWLMGYQLSDIKLEYKNKDVTLDNFRKYVTYKVQNAQSSYPKNFKLSLKELFEFKGELDKVLLIQCCQVCQIDNLRQKLFDKEEIGSALSGGEKTLLILAVYLYKALKKKSKIILIDEPAQGVDTETGEKMLKSVSKLLQKQDYDLQVFLITHDDRILNWKNIWQSHISMTVEEKDGIKTSIIKKMK